MKLTPIHPFPARMAPEIVFEELQHLESSQVVLDPMSGSGTVLRGAAELGHKAIGFDMDPLAVMMSRVWTSSLEGRDLESEARVLVEKARSLAEVDLPWIDGCEETKKYIDFWFLPKQIECLRKIAFLLQPREDRWLDPLRIALSRTIVTKERGASVARDASHSRPHRVFFDNDFAVYESFMESARRLEVKHHTERLSGSANVEIGDSRSLGSLGDHSVDIVITSPPYLNAIDYLRGHRLSLVWLGYGVLEVRSIRNSSIGAECRLTRSGVTDELDRVVSAGGDIGALPIRERGMISRYAHDVLEFMVQLGRVTRPGGRVLLVVGNSCIRGIAVSNASIVRRAAEVVGLSPVLVRERELPGRHRYLPTPEKGPLGMRMKTESLLVFSC